MEIPARPVRSSRVIAVVVGPPRSGRTPAPLYGRLVRYAVTVEPEVPLDHPDAPLARSIIDAGDKDDALEQAERAYRKLHPRVGNLKSSVVRVRPPQKPR